MAFVPQLSATRSVLGSVVLWALTGAAAPHSGGAADGGPANRFSRAAIEATIGDFVKTGGRQRVLKHGSYKTDPARFVVTSNTHRSTLLFRRQPRILALLRQHEGRRDVVDVAKIVQAFQTQVHLERDVGAGSFELGVLAGALFSQTDRKAANRPELDMRTRLIAAEFLAALELNKAAHHFSEAGTTIFSGSNWQRTERAFVVSEHAQPSEAINELLRKPTRFGFECFSGSLAHLYLTLLNTFGAHAFDQLFTGVSFGSEDQLDPNVKGMVRAIDRQPPHGDQAFDPKGLRLGDYVYFKNPDGMTKILQGWNAVFLGRTEEGEAVYYAHSADRRIRTHDEMLTTMSDMRSLGSKTEPHLSVSRMQFSPDRAAAYEETVVTNGGQGDTEANRRLSEISKLIDRANLGSINYPW